MRAAGRMCIHAELHGIEGHGLLLCLNKFIFNHHAPPRSYQNAFVFYAAAMWGWGGTRVARKMWAFSWTCDGVSTSGVGTPFFFLCGAEK